MSVAAFPVDDIVIQALLVVASLILGIVILKIIFGALVFRVSKRKSRGKGRLRKFEVKEHLFTKKEYLLTENEKKMFFALQGALDKRYFIHCQVSMLALVKPNKFYALRKIGAKHVDFVITDGTTRVFAVLELDDKSHKRSDRVARDKLLENILEGNHALIRFETQPYYHQEEIAERLEQEAGIENKFKR